MTYKLIQADATSSINLETLGSQVDLTFLDPPFNQNKEYALHSDNLPNINYWQMMQQICQAVLTVTSTGGAIYFMQREKNVEPVLRVLRESGWTFQNLIIWKKKTSAVPSSSRYGKHYQIIAYATKGSKPSVFNRLRISPPLPANYKYERENGLYVTDIWDDIRELTSGYFAGDEAIRDSQGNRFHKQQAPIALLLRIILSSSRPGDTIFDPFSGTGTTLVTATQLQRYAIGIEIDPQNISCIKARLQQLREVDRVKKYYSEYAFTKNLDKIWGTDIEVLSAQQTQQLLLLGN